LSLTNRRSDSMVVGERWECVRIGTMSQRTDDLLAELTTAEKVDLVTGLDMWHTRPVERLGISSMKVTDGPNGARGDGLLGTGTPTACIPSGSALGATWDPTLVERLGALLGDECRAKGAHVLLAPTINLHRSPKGGRNFECYSEDPVLSAELAAAFVTGVQSRGVATTPKHFVGNDSEYERNTIDVQIDERTLREVYMLPFERAVKAGAWGLMSAYNRLGGTYCSENEWLLRTVLRDEWGFDGFVVSDWFAARSTVASVRAGLSLEMPGRGRWYGDKLATALEQGEVDPADLDAMVSDVLLGMERTGVLDRVGGEGEKPLDRPEDRALIRSAAAAATVLIRNDGVLPLDPSEIESIAVIGPNALNAKIMGGGSATVAAYRAVSPLDALRDRLGDTVQVDYATGCDINRFTPALSRPLLDGDVTIEYFAGQDLAGEPIAAATRNDFLLLFFGEPEPGVPASGYSYRATATVTPTVTGPHALRLVQAGRCRVLVDNVVAIDATEGDHGSGQDFFGFASKEIETILDLKAGSSVKMTLEGSNRDAVLIAGSKLGLVSLVEVDLVSEAVELAARSDVAVVVVGTNDDWETEGRDRDLFELPGLQPELVRRVAAVNSRTIVVVNTGGPHALDWLDEPAAVLSIGFAGQELGDALVDVLLGDSEPGGRMPTTVPARYEHHPAMLNYPGENGVVRYGEGLFVGHRWFDARAIEPAVAFGHGMSYTTFEIDGPDEIGSVEAGESVPVEVRVTNTGRRRGSEVVQIYLEPIEPRLTRPVRELVGFAKVELDPGESASVTIDLDARAFAYYDVADPSWEVLRHGGPVPAEAGHERRTSPGWYVDPGDYRIVVGRSSVDFTGSIVVSLTGESVRVD